VTEQERTESEPSGDAPPPAADATPAAPAADAVESAPVAEPAAEAAEAAPPAEGAAPRPRSEGDRPEGDRDRGGPRERGGRRHFGRRKVCMFCVEKVKAIDYKDPMRLRRFLSDRARIEPRRKTGTCAKHQRWLAIALKRARHLALLPYTPEHIRASGMFAGRR
jgi:small subunit ribosomal protein S18